MSTFLSKVPSTVPTSYSVSYSCTFQNNWSSENHPFNYPPNAHWSPPVIAAHNHKYTMWEPDLFASEGVEQVAETGGTSKIKKEISDARENSFVGDSVQGDVTFNSSTQSQTFEDITLTPAFNTMSSITMVAPSPDWYTGFYNVKPIDKGSQVWLESFKIETFPWDAGTETGDDFAGNNPEENPHVPIVQLTKDTVPDNGVLLSPDETEVLPMATWTCTLVSASCTNHDGVMQAGKQKRTCEWAGKPKKEKIRNRRCGKRFLRKKLSVWCPEACRVCEAGVIGL